MSARKIREWAWPYIKNFRTYIDVGAFDGDTAKPFVNHFEKIIAFEPNPEVFKLIPESIEKVSYAQGFPLTMISSEPPLNPLWKPRECTHWKPIAIPCFSSKRLFHQ